MCFARSSLSIGKDSAIVAIQNLLDQRRHHHAVDIALLGFGAETPVEGELLGELGVQRVASHNFPWRNYVHYLGRANASFPGVQRPLQKKQFPMLEVAFHRMFSENRISPDSHINLDVLI